MEYEIEKIWFKKLFFFSYLDWIIYICITKKFELKYLSKNKTKLIYIYIYILDSFSRMLEHIYI